MIAVLDDAADPEMIERFAAWQQRKHEAGYCGIEYPREHGGAGLDAAHTAAFVREEMRFVVPARNEMLGVTTLLTPWAVLHHGSSELAARFVASFLRGEELCCQLFAEPDAGSDLAALRTVAEPDGAQWRVTGQKLWSSGAHLARWGLLLARTGDRAQRHRTLTMFLIDMQQPGVNVRPVTQMNGSRAFCKVFLDGATVPDQFRLGEVDGGWRVALTTLEAERLHTGARRLGGTFGQLVGLSRHLGLDSDPLVRQGLARVFTSQVLQAETRVRWAGADAVSGSLIKLLLNRHLVAVGDVATECLGPRLAADTGEWGTFAWTEHLLSAPGFRLAGGTDEIQRNLVAERLLGLPR